MKEKKLTERELRVFLIKYRNKVIPQLDEIRRNNLKAQQEVAR